MRELGKGQLRVCVFSPLMCGFLSYSLSNHSTADVAFIRKYKMQI
jgi:hypothetical protein